MAYKIKIKKSKEKISINPFSEERAEEEAFEEDLKNSEDGIQDKEKTG